MSNGVDTFPVNVSCNSGNTSANPPKLSLNRAKGTAITINCNAQGGKKIRGSGFFSWKTSTNPAINPTRSSDGTTLTLDYNMPDASVSWAYNITLSGCVTQDPDIDNEVPPGEEEEKPKPPGQRGESQGGGQTGGDRKSTRLNSSHLVISYAVFCLKKKKKKMRDEL